MARRASVSSVSSEKRFGKAFQYEADFKGPRDKRNCTDILCLGLFIVFLVCWFVLGYLAYSWGDPNRILKPTDFSGQQCGVDTPVINKPYLLFFDPSLCARNPVNAIKNGCSAPSVCVERCPKRDFNAAKFYSYSSLSGLPTPPICLANIPEPRTGSELKELVKQKKCAEWYMNSIELDGRCVLATAADTRDSLTVRLIQAGFWRLHTIVVNCLSLVWNREDVQQTGEMVVSDALASKWFIIVGLVGAMVLSFVYILLLRLITGIIVWASILAVLVLFGVGTYICYEYWTELKHGGSLPGWAQWNDAPAELRSLLDDPTTWLTFMIILAVILVVLMLIVLFLRKRISLAVTLIEEGGKAVSNITATLFFPIVPWTLQVAVLAYTAVVLLYLATSGEAVYKAHGLQYSNCTCVAINVVDNGVCDPEVFNKECHNCVTNGATCSFFRYSPPEFTKWLHVYNIFGAIWALFFISGMAQLILASTFASWYWTFHKSDVPYFVLTRSFFMSITYHSGTVAFGSLIISIVRLIRLILDYIEKQAKQYSNNSVAKAVMCFCRCCFACVEGFLKFISRNAYIMCAVHGKNFCASAKDAFNLLMRNVIRVVVIDKIMDFVFFMGKLLITAVVCTAMHFALKQWPQNLNYSAVPMTISGIGAFLIASVFFGVYSVAVDTLFLCFLEDCERNDGSAQKPYYMSPSLMSIFGKKNRNRRD